MQTCRNCKYLNYESGTTSQPYPEIWCGKSVFDSVDDIKGVSEKNECAKFEPLYTSEQIEEMDKSYNLIHPDSDISSDNYI